MPERSAARRAVDQLIALGDVLLRDGAPSTRQLGTSCGMSPSSGYRHLSLLESRQLAVRDLDGAWMRGSGMLRVGLNAWGIGALFLPGPPVVRQLHDETRETAFLGVLHGEMLWMGPLVPGAVSDAAVPSPDGCLTLAHREGVGGVDLFDVRGDGPVDPPALPCTGAPAGAPADALSDGAVAGHANAHHALLADVCLAADGARAVIGVLLVHTAGRHLSTLAERVGDARALLTDTLAHETRR